MWCRGAGAGWRFSAAACGDVPRRAVMAFWGGWGPHTRCAHQIGPHPPQPTPPSRHGTLRCVWVREQKTGLHFYRCHVFSFVPPHSGAGAHGIARARGEPSDNLCSQCAEDGSPLERARSEETPPQPGRPLTKRSCPKRRPHRTQNENCCCSRPPLDLGSTLLAKVGSRLLARTHGNAP